MKKEVMIVAVCLSLAAGMFSGCSNGKVGNSDYDLDDLKTASYPLETDVELTMFHRQNANWDQITAQEGAKRIIDLIDEKTGVKITHLYPPAGQEEQQFNLMLASGELPDIIDWNWGTFVGGADKAVNDGYILNLNELIEEYSPNFKALLESDPYIDRMVKTDEGNYCYYPGMMDYGKESGDSLLLTSGYVFRKDWLDDLSLPVPETIDDWHRTLTAFKEQKGATAPLCMTASDAQAGLAGAYGINLGFYKDDDGKIQYGYIQPEFQEFVTMMNRWYTEGLIDKNIAAIDSKTVDSRVLNNETGAVFAWLGGGVGKWLTAAESLGMEAFDLVGVPAPVLNKGDRAKYAAKELPVAVSGLAISTACQHKELAVKYLDYGYTEEGHLVYNFGEEGVTYDMVNSIPTYTEFMTNNPEGKSLDEMLQIYTSATGKGPFVMDYRYYQQRLIWPQQKEAQMNWGDNDVDDYQLPVLTPSEEDSKEYTDIMNNINTYTTEMYLKFIVGTEPISNYDSFVQQIRDYGIERAIEIQQASLDRFNNR